MSLRFFADHCVPNAVVSALRAAGHEVAVLKEHIPRDSDDSVVIAKAQELGAILLSCDGDFADIVTYPPSMYQGIVALQVRNRPKTIPRLMERLIAYLSVNDDMEHYSGRLLLAETHRIRSRS